MKSLHVEFQSASLIINGVTTTPSGRQFVVAGAAVGHGDELDCMPQSGEPRGCSREADFAIVGMSAYAENSHSCRLRNSQGSAAVGSSSKPLPESDLQVMNGIERPVFQRFSGSFHAC